MARGFKTGGRRPGSLNKMTADVRQLAQQHGPAAIAQLAKLMTTAENEQVRVVAAKELLDRAYGKVSDTHNLAFGAEHDGGGPHELRITIVDPKVSADPIPQEQYEARRALVNNSKVIDFGGTH